MAVQVSHTALDAIAEDILVSLCRNGVVVTDRSGVIAKAPDMTKDVMNLVYGADGWAPEGAPWPKPEQMAGRRLAALEPNTRTCSACANTPGWVVRPSPEVPLGRQCEPCDGTGRVPV